jgi:cell division protease FtsH
MSLREFPMADNQPPTAPARRPASPPGRRLLWLLPLLLLVVVIQLSTWRSEPARITYSQFETELDRDNVAAVQVIPESRAVRGSFRQATRIDTRETTDFRVVLPFTDPAPLIARLETKGIRIEGGETGSPWGTFLVSILPWILIGGFWLFALRQVRAGGAEALAFGRARTGGVSPERPKITFADVANVEEAKTELQEIVAFLKNPEHFQRLGGHLPKGVLLVGAPGTGKTLLARATAGEAGRPFFTISGSDFVELFVGVGAARVRDLFTQGKAHAPCIIFIDELDAVGRTRGIATVGGAHEEREQTLNQLLVEMDGFEPSEGIILLAATNRPDVLDPALLRPGRFDRRIVVELPDVKGREQILRMHARQVPVAPAVDLAAVARGTPGLSGADLANLVNEAALFAARRQKSQVDQQDFEDAKDKVTLGIERRSLVLTEAERRLTAYHEAGHALVNLQIPCLDPVHKVTIVPRGQALGITYALPEEDRHNYTREYLLGRLAVAQGGRVAEELIFGPEKVTTGAAQDFAQATELARRMVTHFGMTDALGPMGIAERAGPIYLGPEFARRAEISEQTAELIDREIRRLLTEAQDRARTLIRGKLDTLHALAEALLEHETLDRPMLEAIVAHRPVPPVATEAASRSHEPQATFPAPAGAAEAAVSKTGA